MGLLQHITLPSLRFEWNGFSVAVTPVKNIYKTEITMPDVEVVDIKVYVGEDLIDTIPHQVSYAKWDVLSVEYQIDEKLVW